MYISLCLYIIITICFLGVHNSPLFNLLVYLSLSHHLIVEHLIYFKYKYM